MISLYPEEQPWLARPQWGHMELFVQGARACAASHGYKLENFWLKQPGMMPGRMSGILETRGIKGLLCLGSLDPEEKFPAALRKFAVVTQGASIAGPLHRVMSHFAADARLLLEEVRRRGYVRPGLVILASGDRRTDQLYSARFLGFQEQVFAPPPVPILRAETWNEAEFHGWFSTHRPDAILLHQHAPYLAALEQYLPHHRRRVPRDVGLALLDLNPDPGRYAGIRQDFVAMGETAVEMLLGRLLLRDFGLPRRPKVELVVGTWNEGRTLRKVTARARKAGTAVAGAGP